MTNLKSEQEIIEKQKVDSEASIFWSKIAENLPKSIERSALGDEKIFRAFYPVYKEIREHFISKMAEQRKEMTDLLEKHEFKMDIKDYLPKVKAWQGGYDIPFDDGYAQAKKDLLSLINQNQ